MKSFLTAWRFLTVIPLPGEAATDAERLASSLVYYPLVGLMIGAILLLGSFLFALFFPRPLVNLLVLLLLAIVSGAIHLDGFADTIDGFAGATQKEKILQIMRDGSIGPVAVVALFFLLFGKWMVLDELKGTEQNMALLSMPAVGRWAMVLASYLAPYARQEGLGKEIIGRVSHRAVAIASLCLVLLLGAAFRWRGPALICLVALGVLALVRMCSRRIEGMTGDTVGAVGELSELLFLLLITAVPRGV